MFACVAVVVVVVAGGIGQRDIRDSARSSPVGCIVERISLGSLRQSLRITVALSLILVLFSISYGVPISQSVSMYSLIYYEQRSLRDRSTTR